MYKVIFTHFSILFFIVSILWITKAQSSLDHNTGTFQATVFDNGFYGHGAFGGGGNGIKLTGGSDAMYTSSFLLSSSATKTSGYMHSLTIVTGSEMLNSTHFNGFTSNSDFNQLASAVFNDSGAPAINQTGLIVTQTTFSNTGDNFVIVQFEITNNTGVVKNGIYAGLFSDWDVGVANYTINLGGYDPIRNLAYQWENGGSVDSNYYGVVVLSQFGGARVTAYDAISQTELRDSAYKWVSTFLNESITVPADYRTFIGSGPFDIPNGTSVKAGFAFIAGTNLTDLQSKADEAHIKWNNNVIPVELISFSAIANKNKVVLNWKTATEINNRIFEIERSTNNSDFIKIGYRDGSGSSVVEKEYSFIDENVFPGNYSYRLKQIDFNGTFKYSKEIQVIVTATLEYSLFQNYPNPFNPTTFIGYSIPQAVHVKLSVYNVLGSEIDILVDEFQEAGSYSKEFSNVQNGLNLTNGVYFYKLEAGNFTATKKFILMK